jgi:hypothetical protein
MFMGFFLMGAVLQRAWAIREALAAAGQFVQQRMAAFDLGMQCASRVLRAERDGSHWFSATNSFHSRFRNLAQRIHPIRLLRGAGTGCRHHALKRIADIVDALLLPGGRLGEHAFKPLVGGNRQHAHAARLQIGQQVRRGGRNHIEMAACQRHHGFGGGFVGDDAQLRIFTPPCCKGWATPRWM